MQGDKQLLLELVECLSSTLSECTRSIESLRRDSDSREKDLCQQIEHLSARLYKQEKLAADICEEMGESEQRLRDLIDKRIKIGQEELEEKLQAEQIRLLEITQNHFSNEIDKIREVVHEQRVTPKKEAQEYAELSERCARMLQTTRSASERLKHLSVVSPQKSRFNPSNSLSSDY